MDIYWPLADSDGEYLLYLISAKLRTGEDCSVQGGVNPKDLEAREISMIRVGSRAGLCCEGAGISHDQVCVCCKDGP